MVIVHEAAVEIFERYEAKMNSRLGKALSIFHAFLQKCFKKENKRSKTYQEMYKILNDIKEHKNQVALAKGFDHPGLNNLQKGKVDNDLDDKPLKDPEPILKKVEPLSFEEEAFILSKPLEKPVFKLTENEIETLLSSPDYGCLNRDNQTFVRDLIRSTCRQGLPIIANEEERILTAFRLRYIIYQLKDQSVIEKNRKELIKKRLVEAFKACQTIQYEAVNNLYNELCQSNTLESAVKILWENYKTMMFDQWIIERHPESKNPQQTQHQFPHLKNAYLITFADPLGLPGKLFAVNDNNKPLESYILKSQQMVDLVSNFKKHLKANDFITYLCQIINDPDNKLVNKSLIYDWGRSRGINSFGYYAENKNYNGCSKPTEAQEMQEIPYISPDEVEQVLTEAKMLSKIAALQDK